MILLDERVGSRHYMEYLGSRATLAHLNAGDAAFDGNGVTVGIEIKKLLDAVSCIYSGRLADRQIPLMREQYDVAYLIIEGVWRPSPDGILQYWKSFPSSSDKECGRWLDASAGRKRLMMGSFEQWLTTLELMGGVRLRFASSPEVTASVLLSLYTWFQREDHRSFHVMQEMRGAEAHLSRPTMHRRMIAELPHVGWQRSEILAKRFRSMEAVLLASPEDFFIEGEIAEKSAKDIYEALHAEK